MISKPFFMVFALFLAFARAEAQDLPANVIYPRGIISDQNSQTSSVSLRKALSQVKAGEVVILGEQHGTLQQAAQQLEVLKTLRKQGLKVSVGMEFFAYTDQDKVDAWKNGNLAESDFLTQVSWGAGFPFDAYRAQVQFPQLPQEFLIALNAPRSLTGRIAKVGINGLTADEKLLLPPQWTYGNPAYRKRFEELMTASGHVPAAEELDRYFAAQSTWDETMAWQADSFLKLHPEQVLVIIVGEFHVQYGGGVPDRLKAHGLKTTSFSLLNLDGLSRDEQLTAVQPNKDDGERADFVWTSRFKN